MKSQFLEIYCPWKICAVWSTLFSFSSDFHNVLVPPACGTAVAAVTNVSVIPRLQEEGRLPKSLKNIIVIVCGGSGITTDNIEQWRREAVEEGGGRQ